MTSTMSLLSLESAAMPSSINPRGRLGHLFRRPVGPLLFRAGGREPCTGAYQPLPEAYRGLPAPTRNLPRPTIDLSLTPGIGSLTGCSGAAEGDRSPRAHPAQQPVGAECRCPPAKSCCCSVCAAVGVLFHQKAYRGLPGPTRAYLGDCCRREF